MSIRVISSFLGIMVLLRVGAGCGAESSDKKTTPGSGGERASRARGADSTPARTPAAARRSEPRRVPAVLDRATLVARCKHQLEMHKRCGVSALLERSEYLDICSKAYREAPFKYSFACAQLKTCEQWKPCMNRAEKEIERDMIRRAFVAAKEERGKWKCTKVLKFCSRARGKLAPDMKRWCKAEAPRAIEQCFKLVQALKPGERLHPRMLGCYELARVAHELSLAGAKRMKGVCTVRWFRKELAGTKATVESRLKRRVAMLDGNCVLFKLKELEAVGSVGVGAKKLLGQYIDLCYRRMGRLVLKARVPKQRKRCWVRDTYDAIRHFKVHGRVIDRLMKRAARLCKRTARP